MSETRGFKILAETFEQDYEEGQEAQAAFIKVLEAVIQSHDKDDMMSEEIKGWKLVPIEPTKEMLDVAEKLDWTHCDIRGNCCNQYQAMIAAAPEPSATTTELPIDSKLVEEASASFLRQERLPADMEKVLYNNLWELYESDAETPSTSASQQELLAMTSVGMEPVGRVVEVEDQNNYTFNTRYHQEIEILADMETGSLVYSAKQLTTIRNECERLQAKLDSLMTRRQTAKEEFHELGGDEIIDPLERLRFFCALSMTGFRGQDWLDVEPFFDALQSKLEQAETEIAELKHQHAVKLVEATGFMREELAKAEKDAERYRHMRRNATFKNKNGPGLYWYLPRFMQGNSAEQLDAAVDASIAEREAIAKYEVKK